MESVKKKKNIKKPLFAAANVLVIVGLAAFGTYYFRQYQHLKDNPPSADSVQKAENDKIVAKAAKLYNLPSDEQPQVIFVKDKSKLTDQEKSILLAKAETGDYELIYLKNKLAVLYRPSENKIVQSSPVTVNNTALKTKVIGTAVARQTVTEALKAQQITPTDGGDAKTPPTSIVVVDLTGKNADQAKKIADSVKGTVGNLPAGEDKPSDVDILIVAGP